MALKGRYIEADRDYVKYCLRYAVLVLGKRKVLAYIETLDDEGNRIDGGERTEDKPPPVKPKLVKPHPKMNPGLF